MAIVQSLSNCWVGPDPPRLVRLGELFDSEDAIVAAHPTLFSSPIGGAAGGGEHPNLTTHDTLGLTTQAEHQAHMDAIDPHAQYATDSDLTTHAATSHGITTHGGLSGVTADQHHARQHSVTAAVDHTFPGGSTFLRADGTFATPAGGGGGEAFPVGSVFIAVVSTNPATLLGYGTWSQIAQGQFLVGQKAADADFDTAEETGGAKTHTHTDHTGVINHIHPVTDPGHTHLTQRYPTTTGSSSGFTFDTSMSGTLADNTLPTKTATTGVTTTNPAGGVSALTHDAPSHLPPYFVGYIWKRTA